MSKRSLGSALELERAVGGADGDGQRVYAGALGKFLNLIRIGVGGVLGLNLNLILNAGQTAQLALNGNVAVVSILNNLAGQSDVLFEGQVGAVDHDGGKATVDAALAGLEIGAVIQMHNDRQIGVLNSSLDQLHQVYVLGVLARARGYLQDQRSILQLGAFGNALNDLHVVYVERAQRVAAFVGLFEQFLGIYYRHW